MKFLAAASCSFVLALIVSLASATEVPFDQAQFDAARAAGKPVAVVFHAVRRQFRHREVPEARPRGDPAKHHRRVQGRQGGCALDR
jgi:hypothetical protein